jgi:hypothetical protein
MASVLPATIQIQHLVWTADGGTNNRGNPTGALGAPAYRYVIGFYRLHWADPHVDPISVDFLERTIADIVMLVPSTDVGLYGKLDQVLAYDGTQWLDYEVQNAPIPWSAGFTWQRYSPMLAGEVHIRRVE